MKFESPSGYKEPNHGLILFILLSVIGIFAIFNIQKLYTGIKKAFDIEYNMAYSLDETLYQTEKIVAPMDQNNIKNISQTEAVQKVDKNITSTLASIDTIKVVKSIPEIYKIEKDSAEIKSTVEKETETKVIEEDTFKTVATPVEEKKKKFRLFKKKS